MSAHELFDINRVAAILGDALAELAESRAR